MKTELTLFDSIFDNKTGCRLSFNNFELLSMHLHREFKKPGYKPKKGESTRGSSPLISPAVYERGAKRANANVTKWAGWCALDVDDYEGTPDEAMEAFKGYQFICYSSASSTKAHPKFRVVFPLTEDVMAEDVRAFWYALSHEFGQLGDTQCKDLSRMYYVPAQYPNAFNFIFTRNGKAIEPRELMSKHEYVSSFKSSFSDKLPDSIRAAMEQHKKDSLTNTDVSWTSHHDCPFVNKRKVTEYKFISGTGWYAKLYEIMTSIAANAIKAKYPIRPEQIAQLCKQIDAETGNHYINRPLELEAARAIRFALGR